MEKLTQEQLDMLKSINEKSKNDYKAFEKFMREDYPKKSLDDKILYWSELIQKNMKWQEEINGDEYDGMFTKEWFDDNVTFDPEFNKIFTAVAKNLQLDMTKVMAIKNT
jgi:hypothetical protein